ncbi:hypothetical protein ACHAWU_003992 [Discostella pseudostelligera]|uniref:Chromosome transmission fidelity protein 8 n=1 Tax=Discostella pseudostelligera TaxID=259834 RepID=A0ABD3MJB4_9STRA
MTMIIPIRAPSSSDPAGEAEWVMIELNGELLRPMDETMQPQPSQVNTSVDTIKRRVELGSLNFDADGAPTLIIGNHELKGSAIQLKEPFAILRKRKSNKISQMNDKDGYTSSESKRLKSHSGVHLEVVGVVKTKLMFDQYPKSIMR